MDEVKKIRPTYPMNFSIGLLVMVFIIAAGLSRQIFHISPHDHSHDMFIYFGMFLVGIAVVIMALIMWEEILFPLKVKSGKEGMVFRNHRTKLKLQILIYFSIPAIFAFIYFTYEVNLIRYIIWTAICTMLPIAGKIASGVNNYNDFLKLAHEYIEYKNNELEGLYRTEDIEKIFLSKEEGKLVPKIHLLLKTNEDIVIDLDEMELEDFYDSIFAFINDHYKHLLK